MALLNLPDAKIDAYFYLEPSLKAKTLALPGDETYSDGLTSAEALYTSYRDFEILRLNAEKRGIKDLADLGAGISRMAFWMHEMESPIQCSTYEILEERVQVAKAAFEKKFNVPSKNIYHWDLKKSIPSHAAYFLYLPVGKTLRKFIHYLKDLPQDQEVILYVIESHGDLLDFLKNTLPELKTLEKLKLAISRHNPELHVFSYQRESALQKHEDRLLKTVRETLEKRDQFRFHKPPTFSELIHLFNELESIPELQLVIREKDDSNQTWVGDLEGFENGAREKTLILSQPPRTIEAGQILGFHKPQGILKKLVLERKQSKEKPLPRKIFLTPEFSMEYSDGEMNRIPE